MPRAVITLDDQDQNGFAGVGMTLFLENGFTPGSAAHQAANALVQELERMAAVQSQGDLKTVTGPDAAWISSDVVAVPENLPSAERIAELRQ